LLLLAAATAGAKQPPIIRSVVISGSRGHFELETAPGGELDPSVIAKDVKRLWATGRFEDIRVDNIKAEDGADLIFHVVERPIRYLRRVHVDGVPKAKSEIPPATKIDNLIAHQTARKIEGELVSQGYRDAEVKADVILAGGNQADLFVHAKPGPKYLVNQVDFTGNLKLPRDEIKETLAATRPRQILPGIWKSRPPYVENGVNADVRRIRALFARYGYLDTIVKPTVLNPSGVLVRLQYAIDAGPRSEVRQVRFHGMDMSRRLDAQGHLSADALCTCLMAARREADDQGKVDFNVAIRAQKAQGTGESRAAVDYDVDVSASRSFQVGRIEFSGHHAYSDGTIRPAMSLHEADVISWNKLYKSIDRINRLGLFQPLEEKSIDITRDVARGTVDVKLSLKEKGKGGWSLSGPVGPLSFAGPLQGSIMSRLPGWGRGVLEGSTYYLTFGVTGFSHPLLKLLSLGSGRSFVPYISIRRPYLPGQDLWSGFMVSPQTGWKSTAVHYGLTQLQQRSRWSVNSTFSALPLVIPIERPSGHQSLLVCEGSKPRLQWLRTSGALALDWLLPALVF
jgi:outer membrane protein assembly factor BamA